MAVVAVWKCDRDGTMFDNKKDAEQHDNMLELAANITSLLERTVPDLSEELGEAVGLVLANKRELLAKACKGKPSLLLEELVTTDDTPTNVSDFQQASGS